MIRINWKFTNLGRICDPNNGIQIGPFGTQLHATEYVSLGIPVIMPRDIKRDEIYLDSVDFITEEKAVILKKYRLQQGDIIVGRRGTIGNFALVKPDQEGWLCGTDCIRLRLRKEFHPEFIIEILRTHYVQHWLRSNAVGQAMLGLNTEIISNVPIHIPESLDAQIIWSNRLEKWNKAIALAQKLITAKYQFKKGLMQKLLTGKTRFSEFENQSWILISLGDIFDERVERKRDDLPLLAVTGKKGLIYRDELDRRDTSNPDKSKYKRVIPGDIVYNTMRMWQGVSALAQIEGIVSPAYTVVEPNTSIHPDFIKHLFKLPSQVYTFRRYSQGLVNDTLMLKFPQFSRIKVILPNLHEQKRIAAMLDLLDVELSLLDKKVELLSKQKRGLIQEILTGNI